MLRRSPLAFGEIADCIIAASLRQKCTVCPIKNEDELILSGSRRIVRLPD